MSKLKAQMSNVQSNPNVKVQNKYRIPANKPKVQSSNVKSNPILKIEN